ncbi:hypothetical protein ACET3Z_013292 [Daucus carota]
MGQPNSSGSCPFAYCVCIIPNLRRVESAKRRELALNSPEKMSPRGSLFIMLLLVLVTVEAKQSPLLDSSAFSMALDTLQNQINYKFLKIDLLRRAMTHSSYSQENNKALSILGERVIETSVSLSSLVKDIDITAKDLNNKILEVSRVETSCAFDGLRLGLQKVVRVSRKTNSSTPAVVCGSFRAIFGAIAIDKGNSDDAGSVFWYVHGGGSGRAMAM